MSSGRAYASYEATGPNPFLLKKNHFPEHPVSVTTEYWDGTKETVTEDSVKRAIVNRILQKLSFQEIQDLAGAVNATRKPNKQEEEVFEYAHRRKIEAIPFSHMGRPSPSVSTLLGAVTSRIMAAEERSRADPPGCDEALPSLPSSRADNVSADADRPYGLD